MADHDLLTLTEAQMAVGLTSGSSNDPADTTLAAYVTAVSNAIDDAYGPVVSRTITSESHDGGDYLIRLEYRPVSGVTAATEYLATTETELDAATNDSQGAATYLLDAELGLLWRRSGNADKTFPAGRQNVIVTYDAGRYAETASVEEHWKRAAAITLANLWRFEHGAGNRTLGGPEPPEAMPGFLIPYAAAALLDGEARAPQIR